MARKKIADVLLTDVNVTCPPKPTLKVGLFTADWIIKSPFRLHDYYPYKWWERSISWCLKILEQVLKINSSLNPLSHRSGWLGQLSTRIVYWCTVTTVYLASCISVPVRSKLSRVWLWFFWSGRCRVGIWCLLWRVIGRGRGCAGREVWGGWIWGAR